MKNLIITLMFAVLQIYAVKAERVWMQATSVEEVRQAKQFKIYPSAKVDDGTLMCSNDSTSYSLTKTPDGSSTGALWTLESAGFGYYIKNELGYYWPTGRASSSGSFTCTDNRSRAQNVNIVYLENKGFTFCNLTGYLVLNNLNAQNSTYNWYNAYRSAGDYIRTISPIARRTYAKWQLALRPALP